MLNILYMGKFYRKIISIVLIITLLINSNVGAFAQMLPKDLSLNDLKFLVSQTIKPDTQIIDDKYIRNAYQKEPNFHKLFKSLNKQGFENNYGEVCDGEICAPYHTFMRGIIGALLDFADGDENIFINYTKDIRDGIFIGALASEDIKPLRELLKAGAQKTLSYCGTNPFFEGVEELANTAIENFHIKRRDFSADKKAQNNCEKGLAALSILSVVWENKQQADETADLIYKTLKKRYKSKFSSLVLLEGLAALSFIDTDYSYQLIEQFLTKDSIPSRIGTAIREVSLQGAYDSEERRIEEKYNNATSYLNRINARWQYIDEAATKRRGIDPSIFTQVNSAAALFEDDYFKTAYNVVYRNTLTDIGEFLSAQGERGHKLAKKIVKEFVISSYEGENKMHIPLVLGLIQNLDFADAIDAARIINQNFYYDIGGGAGSLIAQKSAIKNSGLDKYIKNTISEQYFLTKAKISRVNFILQLFITVVSMSFLALSIIDDAVNIYRLAGLRFLRFTDTFSATANVGSTAQIAQTGKAAQSLPKYVPALSQAQATQALSQAKQFLALPKPKNTVALPQPNMAVPATTQPKISIPALTGAKSPAIQSLGITNILSKIRNSSQGKSQLQLTAGKGYILNGSQRILSDVDSQYNNPIIDTDAPYGLRKSVFRLAGFDNSFTGFLGKLPYWASPSGQGIFTAGHGVDKFPDKTVDVFSHLGKKITTADVLLYMRHTDKENSLLYDGAILVPHEKIDAEPIDISFNGLGNYKNFVTFSFPRKQFSYQLKTPYTETPDFYYENIDLLQGGAVGGESGSPVIAETGPNKYSVVGMIIANFANKITLVQNLKWVQDFLQGKLTIANIMKPLISLPLSKYGQQLEIPFEWGDTPSSPSVVNQQKVPSVDISKSTSIQSTPVAYSTLLETAADATADPEILRKLRTVVSAELVPPDTMSAYPHAVWRLKDMWGRVVFYLKYGTQEEIEITKHLHEVVSNSDLIKNNPLVKINYPQVVMEGYIPLSFSIKKGIEEDLYRIKNSLWGVGRGKVPFLMTPINSEGFGYYDLFDSNGPEKAMKQLNNQKISLAEWTQIEKIYNELNQYGIAHPDLLRNSFFWRENILNFGIIDLEPVPMAKKVYNNKADLNAMKSHFEDYGVKKSKDLGYKSGSEYWL